MAVIVRPFGNGEPGESQPQHAGKPRPYMYELHHSPDWPPLVELLWRAASTAHHHLVTLEETRDTLGLTSMFLERLVADAEAHWLDVESYARPIVEALVC